MTTIPVGPLSAQSVADLVEELETRRDRARTLLALAPGAYGVEAAVLQGVLGLLDGLLRRPLDT